MSVIMPTGLIQVLRRAMRPEEEDEHGVPVPASSALSVASEPLPGAVREVGDGTWSYRLDPALWPVDVDDEILTAAGVRYVVRTVKLNRNVAASALDYIGGIAVLDPNPRR